MMVRLLAVGTSLALVLGACSGEVPAPDGDPDQPREREQDRGVLLDDDFSDASVGWLGPGETSVQDGDLEMEIGDGRLRIFVQGARTRGTVDTSGLDVENAGALASLTDVRIVVDAERTTNPAGHRYGVVCRMQDADSYYGFTVVEGGRFSIFRLLDGELQELDGGRSEQVSSGEVGGNRIGVECAGNRLRMHLDGEALAEAEDDELTEGAVGLLAETGREPDLEVFFDRFLLRESQGPRESPS